METHGLRLYSLIAAVFVTFGMLSGANIGTVTGQGVDQFKYSGSPDLMENTVVIDGQFNGYTNYWHDTYWKWFQHGNLYQISLPNVENSIAQNKIDIGEELGIAGLRMQEGFLNGLLTEPYKTLEQPSLRNVEDNLTSGNLLIYIDPATEAGQKLADKLPRDDSWKNKLKSHQFGAANYHEVNAYCLENGSIKLFIVSTGCRECLNRAQNLIEHVKSILSQYDLHRGWFGAGTLLHSVTCAPGHPLEVIGKGMNQGNDWFTFSGYMDFMLQKQFPEWLSKVNFPVVTDVGVSQRRSFYGCKNYIGLRLQDTPTEEGWIKFAKDRGGYIFRPVYQGDSLKGNYDGYVAIEGNKKQIDNENIPFILETGLLKEEAPSCMILFSEKGVQLTRERMWEAILSRKEVGILPQGKMLGPEFYRNALQMLLLDRVYLEEYFGNRINLAAEVQDRELIVNVTNTYPRSVSGTLDITVAPELTLKGNPSSPVILPAGSSKTMRFQIQPTLSAMNRTNPIAVYFKWGSKKKGTMAIMDLPRAISVHQLLYGHAPHITYPVTIHNFSDRNAFPVQAQVLDKNNSSVVYEASRNCSAQPGKFQTVTFDLEAPAGQYNVKVSALGAENISQLGVGGQSGSPYLYEVDLNGDGINEYRMENDKVQVTLLSIGARVIEYIVKDRNDNIFFKLWPEKEDTDKRPFRERGFYPYGGFEDFLGQGSVETHKVYDAEIVKKTGDYVQVRMFADYFGNKLEKIFTLYGNSPLLEIRWALTFKNPETNMLGPQPILELGERHWTEDLFTVPTLEGPVEFRMRPEIAYGRVIDLKEGWNAGYDTKQDITFVGAFPVTEPEFLHMFMNHPRNQESHHYYVEFQPWVPIYQKSTMYFSYYIWGASGAWEDGVKALRERNLISSR